MAKRTAIIDIGSNSLSLVVYEKSSRFAFHLIEKVRASVRIGEGAYQKGGELQEKAMDEAFGVLKDFLNIAANIKCRKVLCVATSALRDAPNKKVFLKRVQKELKLGIKIIDGKQEAHFGAVAALNLLAPMEEFTAIDIGGGSTELSKIREGKIIETLSLDLGTVRLKELFPDKQSQLNARKAYIDEVIASVPLHFKSAKIVGIGGTIRALSKTIMMQESYPVNSLHGFSYEVASYEELIEKIPMMDEEALRVLEFSSARFDTIGEGIMIFGALVKHLEAKEVIASKAGVREGVYLRDILRNHHDKFPHNFNVSIKSLIDRFALSEKNCAFVQGVAKRVYEVLSPLHQLSLENKKVLEFAAKLSPISKRINIYSNSDNSFYFLLENLNFTFSHHDKLLLALLLKLSLKERQRAKEYQKYQALLPSEKDLEWMYFILQLSICINSSKKSQEVDFSLEGEVLTIMIEERAYLCKACVEKLQKSAPLLMVLKSSA